MSRWVARTNCAPSLLRDRTSARWKASNQNASSGRRMSDTKTSGHDAWSHLTGANKRTPDNACR
eukprot:scaffold299372_cov13-Tisochrysis_lutea.AAC.1